MQGKTIQILSTKLLRRVGLPAGNREYVIDEIPFTETLPVDASELRVKIENLHREPRTVIFTSQKAVEAVASVIGDKKPPWKFFCTAPHTRELVAKHFGRKNIIGTAANAAGLANQIVDNYSREELVFFCGDQRREELPHRLQKAGRQLVEIIAYRTRSAPRKIQKQYDGILFFSPLAAESFFMENKAHDKSTLFAIGETTAREIGKYSDRPTITAPRPAEEQLVQTMMEFFKTRERE